ncbi:MAG: GNAT family N-acetyltransferase [Pseudomonadota bacterium]
MNRRAANARCPWSGRPVTDDALTQFEGVTVGFCNPGCRDRFDAAVRCFRNAARITADQPEDPIAAVRPFCAEDSAQLWALMRDLAVFEGYVDQFAVTPEALVHHGLGPNAWFRAYVAPDAGGGQLNGMAVTYRVPWTYSMKPRLVLKELFVAPAARGSGLGRALFLAVIHEAQTIGADSVTWTVLPDNEPAKRFYRSQGAEADPNWENWRLTLSA